MNPLIPPMDPQLAAKLNPFMPPQPPPAPSPSLGFQLWAQDPQNAMKVQPAMTSPDMPLQPNHPSNAPQMASYAPPQVQSPLMPPPSSDLSLPASPQSSLFSSPPPVVQSGAQAQLGKDMADYQQKKDSGPGVNQIHNKGLRILGKIGDIAGSVLAPGVSTFIPGTTMHNEALQSRAQNAIGRDQSAVASNLQNQKTALDIQQSPAELEIKKQNASLKGLQAQGSFAQHGLKVVENGDGTTSVVPDEESPVYAKQQAAVQLAQSSVALKKAQTDFENMKGDPNSPVNQQVAQRLALAKQTQDRLTAMMGTMQERADAQMMTAKARVLGTDMNGNPLPGSLITEDGQVVGGMNAPNVRPTGAQRVKGNMAESADQQIEDMKGIVSKRPDIFGPIAGRTTDFKVWLGSQDPDAQRFRAARTIAGDHLAGTFGGRSEAALNALDSAIGHFRDNPAAVNAGLNQLKEANSLFMKAGKVNTVGSKGASIGSPKSPTSYKQTASGPNGHKIGSNDGNTWFDVQTGKPVR